MLLLNPADLAVYRVSKEALVSKDDENVVTVNFDTFEQAARRSHSSLIMAMAAHFPSLSECCAPIVFIRLREGKGYAWASRVRVQHSGQYHVIPDVHILGEDLLLLWPVPMAINWFLICKERARLQPSSTFSTIVDHPPNMGRAQCFQSDFEVDGKVEASDLTVAQRIFIASLAPDLPAFATRIHTDDWCKRIRDVDANNFTNHFLATRGTARNTRGALVVVNGTPKAPVKSKRKRLHASRVVLDLPDELVGRIVCHRLAEVLSNVEAAVSVVAQLCAVSRQFRDCTRDAVDGMVARVCRVGHTLLGPTPSQPAYVQSVLWASGITLRHAFATIFNPDQCRGGRIKAATWWQGGRVNWRAYVHLRRCLAKLPSPPPIGGQMHAFQRRALLWD